MHTHIQPQLIFIYLFIYLLYNNSRGMSVMQFNNYQNLLTSVELTTPPLVVKHYS